MKYASLILSAIMLIALVLNFWAANQRITKLENEVIGRSAMTRNADDPQVAEDITDEKELEQSADAQGSWMPARALEVPTTMSFAGEEVPLNIPDVFERFDRELHINSYMHNSTIFIMKRAGRWIPQIEQILKENGIPEDFKYQAMIESALLNDTSPRGAVGFWQIMEPAGKELGLEIRDEVDERYDPLKATVAACKYLKKAHDKFGSWTLAAASYDRGMAGLDRALENQHVKSYYDLFLNDETARYVFRLLAVKEIMEHPQKYGFDIGESALYKPEPVRYVEVNETQKDLVDFAIANGTSYKILKRLNPWLRDDRLTIKKNRVYKIALPAS
ncbi:MAG TPA: lytic transglycosylase domain-containing protein [Cyclobacteriaceae bacterium]